MAPVTRVIEIYRAKMTEGNVLDVTATGAAGIDWANVENPTTALNLSGTNIDVDQIVASVSGAVGSVTGAVGSVTGAVGSVTGNVGGNVVGSVASVTGGINTGAGTITTLDGLDTAQDTQHSTTQSAIGGLNNLSAAQVNAEVDTALADYDAPTNTEMLSAFTEIKGATWATTDTLEAIRDRGDAAWTTATGFATHSAADVWSVATRVLTANTNLNDPTAAAVADAVWDEVRSGHVTQGTYGESFGVIVKGTVSNAVTTPLATEFAADDITEATGSHYNGRTIIFTTGALAGQATDITAYSLVSSEGKFTVTALTEAPANDDQFIII